MKKIILYIVLALFTFSCSNKDDNNESDKVSTTFTFNHYWDGALVSNINFDAIQYTNANGELLSIERLRYVISDIIFTPVSGDAIVLDMHYLVDVTNNNVVFTPDNDIPAGNYNVSFTFGLDNEDNAENYPDLNSASFNVPDMLGGGYHYMQFDGKFINASMEEQGFNYHAIRAVDNPGPNPTFPQDTFFEVDLGSIDLTADTEIRVGMNIAEWFKNPNQWDLNQLSQMLMPNSAAQILMYQNGQNVFSFESAIQYSID